MTGYAYLDAVRGGQNLPQRQPKNWQRSYADDIAVSIAACSILRQLRALSA